MSLTATVASVLVWWFVGTSGPGMGRVVGPFKDQASCEEIRKEYNVSGNNAEAKCWLGPR